ncbi:MAG TPA: hypothetical protein VH392_10180, partial [Sphingomicrobium sp.]
MRFDDRLLTVLNQPAGDSRDTAVRWRQLVDLVARAGSNATSPTVAQALQSIRDDAHNVDEDLRAAAARAVAALPLPLGLLEYFASDRLTVSAPVLAAATLTPDQWQAFAGIADEETQRFIETLHPEFRSEPLAAAPALPEPDPEPEAEPEPTTEPVVDPGPELTDWLVETRAEEPAPEPPAPEGSTPSLHEVVQRIERRRRMRATMRRRGSFAAIPQGTPSLFRWECGPGGEIAWVEGVPRGPLIGRSISRAQNGDDDRVDAEVVRAFMVRAPFRDAGLTVAGDGIVSGQWKISGVPAFDPADGRFRGYRGIALREPEDAGEAAA